MGEARKSSIAVNNLLDECLSNIRQTSDNNEQLDTDSELTERAQTSRATMAKIEYVSEKLGENQDAKAERQLELSC